MTRRPLRSTICLCMTVLAVSAFLPAGAQDARLEIVVLDAETARPTPVRVRLTDASGHAAPLPEAAIGIMYGHWDHADGYAYQPDSAYYVDGGFQVDLEPGTYTLVLSKGNEYVTQRHTIELQAGEQVTRTFEMQRWIDMPSRGWYATDGHVHIRRSPREDPHILDWVAAEGINVGVLLWMGDFWATDYAQYAFGREGIYQEGDHMLTSGQEDPRTPELGHALGLGASDKVRDRSSYYYYDLVFERLRELGGVAGYAHQGATFHGYRGLTLDGLRGKVDVVELLQFCADEGPLFTEHFYHLLDLGYEVTAVAGSDFPWCGKDHRYGFDVPREGAAQIGNARFYVYTGGPLTYESWRAGLDAGHTFVSSGPVVLFEVDGHLPGERVDVEPGATVHVSAHAYGHAEQVPLSNLQIIGHGRVLYEIEVSDPGQSPEHLSLDVELPVGEGLWLAARVEGGEMQYAHTTPVYLTVDGSSFRNPATVEHHLDRSEAYLRELEEVIATPTDDLEHHAWRYRDGLQQRIDETRAVIDSLRAAVR